MPSRLVQIFPSSLTRALPLAAVLAAAALGTGGLFATSSSAAPQAGGIPECITVAVNVPQSPYQPAVTVCQP